MRPEITIKEAIKALADLCQELESPHCASVIDGLSEGELHQRMKALDLAIQTFQAIQKIADPTT